MISIAAIGHFFFNTRAGQVAAIAAGAVMLFTAWLVRHDARVATAATTGFATEVTKQTEKAREKAVQARKPAELPGAARRLLDTSCRDCGPKAVPVPK